MSGLGYDATIVLYNTVGGAVGTTTEWYGTEIGSVRVELTQGANIQATGMANANVCVAKVYDENLPKKYYAPVEWQKLADKTAGVTFDSESFYIITKKADLNISITAPTGKIASGDSYKKGLFAYLKATYGMTFRVTQADHYSLIPHWIVGGA